MLFAYDEAFVAYFFTFLLQFRPLHFTCHAPTLGKIILDGPASDMANQLPDSAAQPHVHGDVFDASSCLLSTECKPEMRGFCMSNKSLIS